MSWSAISSLNTRDVLLIAYHDKPNWCVRIAERRHRHQGWTIVSWLEVESQRWHNFRRSRIMIYWNYNADKTHPLVHDNADFDHQRFLLKDEPAENVTNKLTSTNCVQLFEEKEQEILLWINCTQYSIFRLCMKIVQLRPLHKNETFLPKWKKSLAFSF